MLPRNLIVEGPQAPSQLGEEQGPQVVVLQHYADIGGQLLGAVVEILHTVGEDGGQEAVAHEQLVILVQGGAGEALDVGHLVEGGEGGFAVEMSGGEEDFAYGKGHGGDSFRLRLAQMMCPRGAMMLLSKLGKGCSASRK